MERDLFYYVFENNEKRYSEIFNLIGSIEDMQNLTDEELIFLKDFYFRLLFRIAVLEYKGNNNLEIVNSLNIVNGVELLDENKVEKLKNKFIIVIDKMKEILEELFTETISNEFQFDFEGREQNAKKY